MKQIVTQKIYTCYVCKQEVIFRNEFYYVGPQKKYKLYNKDGSLHTHSSEQKQKYSSDKSRRWWFGYGRYRYRHGYKREYSSYNGREYDQRYRENKEKRDQYKQKYASNLDFEAALKILELGPEILKLAMKEFISTVKAAYRKLVFKYHPDKSRTNETARLFQQVTEAYEVLETRFNYTS